MTELEELSAEERPLEWDTPLFRTAMTQFEQAIPYAEVNESIVERLRYPERAVMVAVPIRREAGHVEVFPAYRVQHSSVLGPTKGGIRYDPHVTLGECAALAIVAVVLGIRARRELASRAESRMAIAAIVLAVLALGQMVLFVALS